MKTNLEVVRVQDIILDDNHSRYLGENSIGTILYTPLNASTPINNDFTQLPSAKPLFYNISHYPIANELVYIVGAPNFEYNENSVVEAYYLPPISINKAPNNNSYPNVLDENGEFRLGEYFQEIETIRPLRPYEGDIMIEGRFGNSLRFGYTIDNTIGVPNRWSNEGEIGNPITIIRNGQVDINDDENYNHVLEDIDGDNSSIYLTTSQKIPIEVASNSYNSYENIPTSPNEYVEDQVILNSGRLLFNSKSDSILLSSNQSINLNSITSVNIDTSTLSVKADKVTLGDKTDNEPILLGNKTIELLNTLLEVLINTISKACRILNTFDLSGNTLYTSCEPCPMCLGAIYWAHLDKVYYSNTKTDAKNIGFDDSFIYDELDRPIGERIIPFYNITTDVAQEAFNEWKLSSDKTEY